MGASSHFFCCKGFVVSLFFFLRVMVDNSDTKYDTQRKNVL